MYASAPSAAQLAQLGLSPGDFDEEEGVVIWPEHWKAFRVFNSLQTQWRMTSGGMGSSMRAGLDYQAIPVVMDFLGIPAEERGDVFADVQVLEFAALEQMHKE